MTENKSEKEDNLTTITEKVNTKVKAPKNVRQIGKIGDGLRIYVEDYVKTYTKQLAESDYASRSIAVLVGEYRHVDTERNVFLYGAIKVETEEGQERNIFNEETWTSIYEKIKQYFPDAEIVGWYYGGTGFGPEDLEVLEQIHVNNFAGRDKVLLTYDILEKDNNIYLYDGISMVLQSGYYIYYEKNLEMQSYMVDHKKVKREEEDVDDHATVKMRTILNEKKPPEKKEKEQKMMLRLGYAAAGMVLVVTLIVGYTMIGNNARMKDLEGDIQTMKNIFEKDPADDSSGNLSENTNNLDTTDELVDSDVVITPTNSPTDKPIEMTPTTMAIQPTSTPTEVAPTATIAPKPTDEPIMSFKPDELVEYTIKDGDTLASISLRECGDYNYLSAIKELNAIQDEDVIYVGQIILIPKK
jgi:hypothetical protein